MFDPELGYSIPTDRNSLLFFSLSGLAMLLTLVALIFRLSVVLTPSVGPVLPVNPPPTSSNQTTSTSSTEKTQKSTTEATNTSSTTPLTSDKQTIILAAKEAASDDSNGENIKTYTVDKFIEKKGLVTSVVKVSVAKLTKESMADIDLQGEGIVDIELEMENKDKKEVLIHPQEVLFTIDKKTYPVQPRPEIVTTTLKQNDLKELSLVTALPKLADSGDIKELSFNWQTKTEGIVQNYDVLIVLKE